MAKMIPSTIHADIKSGAEKRIFRLFSEAKNTDDWVVLHSLGLARHIKKRRGEIDFLVINGRGVFVLEIKGGRISRKDGKWKTINKYGDINNLKESPFDQASGAMFSLQNDLKKEFGPSSRLGNLLFGYGAMFPDTERKNLGSEGDPAITYTIEDRRFPISKYIGQLATFTEQQTSIKYYLPEKADIVQLVDFLRGDFDLMVPLWAELEETSEQLLKLTKEQYELFDILQVKPRVLVSGSAGTGKTLIAKQEAIQSSRKRKKVLVVCYNKNLAAHLRGSLKKENVDNISVFRIYELMKYVIEHSSLAGEFRDKSSGVNPDCLYGELFPEYAALAATDEEFVPWDTLIVDEGQDFAVNAILDFLDQCIDGGFEAGEWRWFMDDNNQAGVFGRLEDEAVERLDTFSQGHTLTVNCRNTIQIQDEMLLLTEPLFRSKARVAGPPVKYLWYASKEEEVDMLEEYIVELLQKGVLPEKIVVLSPSAIGGCAASKISRLILTPLTEKDMAHYENKELVRYSTVSSYKGLENEIVILTDIENMEDDWSKSVLYVGMSRAKGELVLMLPKKLKKIYTKKIEKQLRLMAVDDS